MPKDNNPATNTAEILAFYTLKNKGASRCHLLNNIIFFLKKEGSLCLNKVLQIIKM